MDDREKSKPQQFPITGRSRPVERREARAADAVPSITFSWGELRRGDCHETNGVLTLWADGRGRWTCRTWTDHTHSGDEWDRWFGFKDSRGFYIGHTDDPNSPAITVGVFKSPRMSNGGPQYDWSADFVFPAERFSALAAAAASDRWATC